MSLDINERIELVERMIEWLMGTVFSHVNTADLTPEANDLVNQFAQHRSEQRRRQG